MIIVVTGSIGTGKSTVCKILSKLLKIKYVDADKVGHKILRITSIKKKIRRAFGDSVFVSGYVSRKKLAEKAFENNKTVDELNKIVHPEINKLLNRKIATNKIIESSAHHGLNLKKKYILIEVKTKESIVESRLKNKELIKRKAFHKPIKGAEFIIYNNSSRAELEKKIEGVLRKIKCLSQNTLTRCVTACFLLRLLQLFLAQNI